MVAGLWQVLISHESVVSQKPRFNVFVKLPGEPGEYGNITMARVTAEDTVQSLKEGIALPQSCRLYLDSVEVSTTPLVETTPLGEAGVYENIVLRAGDPAADGGQPDKEEDQGEEEEEEEEEEE